MTSFNFISGDDFRICLDRDYKELQNAIETQSWKSAIVIAGSIIEAILIDYLVSENHDTDPLRMEFVEVIRICKQRNLLTERSEQLSHVIRNYRNLIHPGREIRLKEKVDRNAAIIASTLVDMVVEEIAEKRKATYGYTAEQIITKLEKDSSSHAIIPELLKGTKEKELKRLLIEILPNRYFEIETPDLDTYAINWDYIRPIQKAFKNCFRHAFNMVSDDAKKTITKKFVTVIREENEYKVLTYETVFFRASDLEYLVSEDVSLVKQHLFSQLRNNINENLLDAINGLAPYINPNKLEIFKLVDPLITSTIRHQDETIKLNARMWLITNFDEFTEPVRAMVLGRFDVWEKRIIGNNEQVEALRFLRKSMEYTLSS
ncbi:MAG TPA: hypothetical protein VFJ29_00655 [Candidatus Kapabacteria bacterium]|nr:hypothetical protein [Candidatus Kapabacteria bacterium]